MKTPLAQYVDATPTVSICTYTHTQVLLSSKLIPAIFVLDLQTANFASVKF